MSGLRGSARWRRQGTHRSDPGRRASKVFAASRNFIHPIHQEISMQAITQPADLHIEIAELGEVGETLSHDEIELVAGGVGADFTVTPQRTCPHTKPIDDDFSCLGGWID
jgi:hypothetical protein